MNYQDYPLNFRNFIREDALKKSAVAHCFGAWQARLALPSDLTEEESRKAFEKHYEEKFGNCYEVYPSGNYNSQQMRDMWECWQAAPTAQ